MAYPKVRGTSRVPMEMVWRCSRVLSGRVPEPELYKHSQAMPFAEVPLVSELDPRAKGESSRRLEKN